MKNNLELTDTEKVKELITENFSFLNSEMRIEPDMLDMYAKFVRLFQPDQRSHLVKALNDLESELKDAYELLNDDTNKDPKERILSRLLTINEISYSYFTEDENSISPKKAPIIGPLSSEKFFEQLRLGRPFKDPTIVNHHGEFTHRIQWHLANRLGIFDKGGGSAINEAYTALAEIRLNGDSNRGLWNFLCDIDQTEKNNPFLMPSTSYERDFRCPQYLNLWLSDEENMKNIAPTLSKILNSRKKKRDVQDLKARQLSIPVQSQYLSRKIYGADYDTLNKTQKDHIRQLTKNDSVYLPDESSQWGYKIE